MKIYIVGVVSSGKSTLAKMLSKICNIPYLSLDEVVHIPDKTHSSGNRKRQTDERDEIFYSFIKQSKWIIEDTGRPCFEEGLKEANTIVLLDVSHSIRKYRILKRWINQCLGLEKCIYRPSIKMFLQMFQWSKNYDIGKDNLKKRISLYQNKIITLRNSKDINLFLEWCSIQNK